MTNIEQYEEKKNEHFNFSVLKSMKNKNRLRFNRKTERRVIFAYR